jgi:hypothetical protein
MQQLVSDSEWQDHGYVYELEDGRCTFRFNPLVWESTGSRLSAKLYKSGAKLEDVQQVIPAGERLRWLEIEEIEGKPEEIKAALDEACQIPRPVSIAKPLTV